MSGATVRAAVAAGIGTLAMAGWTAASPNGAALYAAHCAKCHDRAAGHVPTRAALANRSAINIVMTLLAGAMRPQAAGLSHDDATAIAAYLTAGSAARATPLHSNRCRRATPPAGLASGDWNGWGRDLENTRYQPRPQLRARRIPRLKLKWAFAYPGSMTWGQPTVVGGRVYVASTTGEIFALEAASGCTLWSRNVGTPVRTAISIGPGFAGHRAAAYFGDISAVVHGVDADTGAPIWHVRVDPHPMARVTGSPVLYRGELFVPVSSFEEGAAADSTYHCCTFRGSVVALDARSGRILWKRRTIRGPLESYHRPGDPTLLHGPAGGSVWSAPTVDAARGVLYVGTGNDYTDLDSPATDSVMAIDLKSGRVVWSRQLAAHDDWSSGCSFGGPCPPHPGADADFAASTILVTLPSGRQVLVAGQKSGLVYGLDPDARGRRLWRIRVGSGGVFGGIEWGMAAIGGTVYAAVSDSMPTHPADAPRSPRRSRRFPGSSSPDPRTDTCAATRRGPDGSSGTSTPRGPFRPSMQSRPTAARSMPGDRSSWTECST